MYRFEQGNFDDDVHAHGVIYPDAVVVSAKAEAKLNLFATRVFDLSVCTLAFLLLLPVFVVVALTIKFDSRGGIFYRQQRHGLNGRTFEIFKFRTMRSESGEIFSQCVSGDPRVTGIGKFLRRTSIDELPQLLNIIKGNMSIVGPRPHAVEHDEEFAKLLPNYLERYRVKPGLTGLAQIRGLRGPTPTIKAMAQRVAADLEYVQTKSLAGDLAIILHTVPLVISTINAH